MEISLIRHGKSKLTSNIKLTYTEFQHWIEDYNNSGVFKETSYPKETLEIITRANIVITSDLVRSIESAKLLNPKLEFTPNSLFRETELPHCLPLLRRKEFPPSVWAVILRCFWFLGYSNGCESLSDAKLRAKKATEILIKYAEKYQYVVLIGHGFFNMLIAKELRRVGFKGKQRTNSKHWYSTTYSLSKNQNK